MAEHCKSLGEKRKWLLPVLVLYDERASVKATEIDPFLSLAYRLA